MPMIRVKTNGDTWNYGASVTALDIAVPTGHVVGGRMLIFAMCDAGGESLPVTGGGWAKLETGTASALSTALYERVATGSEPSSYEITCSYGNNMHVVMIAYDPQGGTLDDIEDADSTTDDATSRTSTTLSVTADEDGCFACSFANDGNKSVTTPPAGTQIYQSTGSSTAFGVYAQEALSAGGITDQMYWSANDQVEAQAVTISATGAVDENINVRFPREAEQEVF